MLDVGGAALQVWHCQQPGLVKVGEAMSFCGNVFQLAFDTGEFSG